ncbi:nucleotidyltransferase family protein [Mesorhizobium sp. RP14(2022)]|uniref:Nucleotidyltransferase family protein n=1 Tax=Mesorhizobium liriopis TaxID=2953882 RepID=A0ABT1C5R5_9HYPH|nr:nucleotidyltransferase family protein [Mesorhizobium liriopis]MCO6050172.1 nucleotidyltransferase family protein [Mesorhizobium liriopis]
MRELLGAICLKPNQLVSDAVACIEASGGEIALVIDEQGRLLGTITDGDIRRGLLRGVSLETPALEVTNQSPRTVREGTPRSDILTLLRREQIGQVPVLSSKGMVIDVLFADELTHPLSEDHTVVIMAGGLGTRLRPITETIPKPMIPVGGRPILEIIIEQFAQQGFRKVTLCLNHLAEIIQDHFQDGTRFGVQIEYVRESKRMGTAGALSLLSPAPLQPMIVMNGDILTSVNFNQLLSFHRENDAIATMGLNRYQYQLPYGVVDVHKHHIERFTEKPVYDFFVNAGIYVISPAALNLVPHDIFFDMPSLFELVPTSQRVAFPIHEYWLDIGRHNDLEKATQEYILHFGNTKSSS